MSDNVPTTISDEQTLETIEVSPEGVTYPERAKERFGAVLSRPDGTYVIERFGMPYHVIESDPLHAEVVAYLADEPEMLSPEPPPPESTPEEVEAQRVAGIRAQLAALDAKAVRPLRAIAAGTAADADRQYLADLEAEATSLRASI